MSQKGFTCREWGKTFFSAIYKHISYRPLSFNKRHFLPLVISFKDMHPLVEVSYRRYKHYSELEKNSGGEIENLYSRHKRQSDLFRITQYGTEGQISEICDAEAYRVYKRLKYFSEMERTSSEDDAKKHYPRQRRYTDIYQLSRYGTVDQIFEVLQIEVERKDIELQNILIGSYMSAYRRELEKIMRGIPVGDPDGDASRHAISAIGDLDARVKVQMERFTRPKQRRSSSDSLDRPLFFRLEQAQMDS